MICVLFSATLRAELTIDITQTVDGATPIAIAPFSWAGPSPAAEDMAAIIAADLRRSGRFEPAPNADIQPPPQWGQPLQFPVWRARNMEYMVVGNLQQRAQDQFVVQFQLFDIKQGTQLTGYSISSTSARLRKTAHQISDLIYKAITGERGAFDTHIAYVTVVTDRGGRKSYNLSIADADGFNEQIIYTSTQPVLSPTWSPDGKHLAYVSYSRGRPELYVQNIQTRIAKRVAAHAGLNNAPAFSPDGRQLAMTLSKDGNAEIYIMELATERLQRITNNSAIDTEPAWLPDGRGLIFTSDRGGAPQLYQVDIERFGRSTPPRRLTFEGSYNARAAISPKGTHVAMVHRNDKGFHIAVLDLQNRYLTVLTDNHMDESPSFSPNGQMIIHATEDRGKGVLSAVSIDGRAQQRLRFLRGDVREPTWSPFMSSN
ncbi:MAG: Tol-Pal system beta propeller repeat protein TolB [Gammaproteobacteria bacterium]